MELVTEQQLKRASVINYASQLDTANARHFDEKVFKDYRYVVGLWTKECKYRSECHKQDLQLIDNEVKDLMQSGQKVDWKLFDARKKTATAITKLPTFHEYIKDLRDDLEWNAMNPEHYE